MGDVESKAENPARWDDWFHRWPDFPSFRWPELFGSRFPELFEPRPTEGMTMRVEQFEENGSLVVRGEIPGAELDDIDITVFEGRLTIRAERKQETEKEEQGRYHSEFRYGAYGRSIPLPAGVTDEDIKATYSNGILEVRMPLQKERAEAKKIPIAHD